MKIYISYEISDKTTNIRTLIFGILYFFIKLISLRAYILEGGVFNPDVFHTSKFTSLVTPLAVICCYRSKILNGVSALTLPMILVAFIFDDIPVLLNMGDYSIYWIIDALFNHLFTFLVGFYIVLTSDERLTDFSLLVSYLITLMWFLIIDDHINGTLNGLPYIIVAILVVSAWDFLFYLIKIKNQEQKDKLIAPILNNISISLK